MHSFPLGSAVSKIAVEAQHKWQICYHLLRKVRRWYGAILDYAENWLQQLAPFSQ